MINEINGFNHQPLEINTVRKETTNTITSTEQGQLEEAISGVISMQAVSMLFSTMSSGEKSIEKPSVLKEELKEMEKKEEQERRRRV